MATSAHIVHPIPAPSLADALAKHWAEEQAEEFAALKAEGLPLTTSKHPGARWRLAELLERGARLLREGVQS